MSLVQTTEPNVVGATCTEMMDLEIDKSTSDEVMTCGRGKGRINASRYPKTFGSTASKC